MAYRTLFLTVMSYILFRRPNFVHNYDALTGKNGTQRKDANTMLIAQVNRVKKKIKARFIAQTVLKVFVKVAFQARFLC